MQLHSLKKNKANKKSKQVGRGGTRGKTSGRGTKGQNARSGRKKRPEMRDFIKKLPKLRGRGKNFLKSRVEKPFVLNAVLVNKHFENGEIVNIKNLVEKGLLSKRNGKIPRVKIVNGKALDKKFKFEGVAISGSVKS